MPLAFERLFAFNEVEQRVSTNVLLGQSFSSRMLSNPVVLFRVFTIRVSYRYCLLRSLYYVLFPPDDALASSPFFSPACFCFLTLHGFLSS